MPKVTKFRGEGGVTLVLEGGGGAKKSGGGVHDLSPPFSNISKINGADSGLRPSLYKG